MQCMPIAHTQFKKEMLHGSYRVQKGDESGRSRHSSNYPMLASSGYKYSVEASVVSNSKASRRFCFIQGSWFRSNAPTALRITFSACSISI